jgi:hypothetical protein
VVPAKCLAQPDIDQVGGSVLGKGLANIWDKTWVLDDGEGDLLEICLKSGLVLSIQSVTFSLVPVVLYCLQAFSFIANCTFVRLDQLSL